VLVAHQGGDALDAFGEVVVAEDVADSAISGGAERFSRYEGDVGELQDQFGELEGAGGGAAVQRLVQQAGEVRVDVERACWCRATDADRRRAPPAFNALALASMASVAEGEIAANRRDTRDTGDTVLMLAPAPTSRGSISHVRSPMVASNARRL
jgi:hypothetical protein